MSTKSHSDGHFAALEVPTSFMRGEAPGATISGLNDLALKRLVMSTSDSS